MIEANILQKISEIESEFNVEILYAIESGSRAWGFESADSDYDVRFIYKNKPDWYLSILPKRDVIEIPIGDLMDYSGWDLRKAFFLMNKSNPVLFEWLISPIVYKKNQDFYNLFVNVSKDYFSSIGTVYHYLSMASRNFREYLKADIVKTKKYFYVLRPLLACAWVELNNTSPPMEFQILLDETLNDKIVKNEILSLLEKKRSGIELGSAQRIDILNEFIANQILHFEKIVENFNPAIKPNSDKMDAAFQKILYL